MKLRIGLFICTFLIPAMFIHGVAHAGGTPVELPCLEKIGEDPAFTNLLDMYFKEEDKLSTALLKGVKEELYTAISGYFFKYCTTYEEWNKIADAENFRLEFKYKNQKYGITVNTDALFKINPSKTPVTYLFFAAPTSVMALQPIGTELVNTNFPSNDPHFPKECSPDNHFAVRDADRADLGRAAKALFPSLENFFINHDVSSFVRGVLIRCYYDRMDSSHGHTLHCASVGFSDYYEGRQKLKELATKLTGSACRNLVLYQVTYGSDSSSVIIVSEPIVIGT